MEGGLSKLRAGAQLTRHIHRNLRASSRKSGLRSSEWRRIQVVRRQIVTPQPCLLNRHAAQSLSSGCPEKLRYSHSQVTVSWPAISEMPGSAAVAHVVLCSESKVARILQTWARQGGVQRLYLDVIVYFLPPDTFLTATAD